MPQKVPWLPSRFEFHAYGNDWIAYRADLEVCFKATLMVSPAVVQGLKCNVRWPETFEHLTTEDRGAAGRVPALDRCERVGWVRPMLDRPGVNDETRLWRTTRPGGHHRLLIALDDFSYLVVFEERRTGLHLITAYPVVGGRRRLKLYAEWMADPGRMP